MRAPLILSAVLNIIIGNPSIGNNGDAISSKGMNTEVSAYMSIELLCCALISLIHLAQQICVGKKHMQYCSVQ